MHSDLRLVYLDREAVRSKQEDAELVRMLGCSILVLAVIPALFTAFGLVVGSLFWLWWTALQILAGTGFVGLATYMHARSVQLGHHHVYKPSALEQAEFAAENYESRAA